MWFSGVLVWMKLPVLPSTFIMKKEGNNSKERKTLSAWVGGVQSGLIWMLFYGVEYWLEWGMFMEKKSQGTLWQPEARELDWIPVKLNFRLTLILTAKSVILHRFIAALLVWDPPLGDKCFPMKARHSVIKINKFHTLRYSKSST